MFCIVLACSSFTCDRCFTILLHFVKSVYKVSNIPSNLSATDLLTSDPWGSFMQHHSYQNEGETKLKVSTKH